jgi:exonuclease SbcD
LDWFGPHGPYTQYTWPDNVTIFESDRLGPVELADGLTVWGGAHRSGQCTARFLSQFSVDRRGVNIGLFHASEHTGTQREPDAGVCSSFGDAEVESAGLSHAFVGHFQMHHLGDHHTYPGAPISHEFGCGPTGRAILATIEANGVGERKAVPITSPPLHDVTVDVTGVRSRDDLMSVIRDGLAGLAGVARIRLSGVLSGKVGAGPENLVVSSEQLEHVVVDSAELTYELRFDDAFEERTVRSEFVRDVLTSNMSDAQKHRIILIGLGALKGQESPEADG